MISKERLRLLKKQIDIEVFGLKASSVGLWRLFCFLSINIRGVSSVLIVIAAKYNPEIFAVHTKHEQTNYGRVFKTHFCQVSTYLNRRSRILSTTDAR